MGKEYNPRSSIMEASRRPRSDVRLRDSVSLLHRCPLPDSRDCRNGRTVRMPVDLFPPINIPVVVVATFYSGMPPQQIETDITDPGAYTKPFTISFTANLRPKEELMEYICQENQQDAKHLVGFTGLQ